MMSDSDLAKTTWPILRSHLRIAVETIRSVRKSMEGDGIEAIESRGGGDDKDPMVETQGGVRIIRLRGVMIGFDLPQWICEWFGLCVTARVMRRIETAEDDASVERIVLDVDSPGGQGGGVPELANTIRKCRTRVEAHVGGMCASAAYWVASAAKKVTVEPNGLMGSVGAVLVFARLKPEHSRVERLEIVSSQTPKKRANVFDDDPDKRKVARAEMQRIVNEAADVFIGDITKHRGDHGEYADGRLFTGQKAVDAGFADRVSFLRAVLGGRRNRTEVPMSGKETGKEGAGGETGAAAAEKTRIGAINGLPNGSAPNAAEIKLQAIVEGKTVVEAAVMLLSARPEPPKAGGGDGKEPPGATGEGADGHRQSRETAEATGEFPDAASTSFASNEDDAVKAMLALDKTMPDAGERSAGLMN